MAPAVAHLAVRRLRRRELQVVDLPSTPLKFCWHSTTLPVDRRSAAASSLRHFLNTPKAMRLLRTPGAGLPASRSKPPVYVTIWS
jgi:hypothetical protein